MTISLDIPGCDTQDVFENVFKELRRIDKKFSTYKEGSEVSKCARGELKEHQLSNKLNAVIKSCRDWEKKTDGYFSAWYGGKFDPSGYVKGWAIAEAGKTLDKQGYKTYCVGAGGDILARSDSSKIWDIGIQDPNDKTKVLSRLSISNGAVATSGTYERGEHIINPKTGKPAAEFVSITVTGPDIVTADVLATTAFAMGKKGVDFINKQNGYRALAVARKVI